MLHVQYYVICHNLQFVNDIEAICGSKLLESYGVYIGCITITEAFNQYLNHHHSLYHYFYNYYSFSFKLA